MSTLLLQNDAVWSQRWRSLRGSIVTLIESLVEDGVEIGVGALDGDDLSDLGLRLERSLEALQEDYQAEHNKNVAELLVRLLLFSDTLFHFFHNGFFQSGAQPKHESPLYHSLTALVDEIGFEVFFADSKHPADAVLNALLRQTADDFVRIQQVFHTRFGEARLNGDQRKNLLMATLLIERGIRAFQNSNLTGPYYDEIVVLAYPNDRLEVRLQPYCESLFIGFPVTAYYLIEDERRAVLSTDYIALAHEAGHVAYRFGRLPEAAGEAGPVKQHERTVRHALSLLQEVENVSFAEAWLEELFCDLYGCLIEGPVFAVGFQALLINNPPEDFLANNYPIPALRPLIQTEMLRILAERGKGAGVSWPDWVAVAADQLDVQWQNTLNHRWGAWFPDVRGGSDQLLDNLYVLPSGRKESGRTILDQMAYVVMGMVDKMLAWGFQSDGSQWQGVYASAAEVAAVEPTVVMESLYRQYCDTAAQALIAEQEARSQVEDETADDAVEAYAAMVIYEQIPDMKDADDLIFFLLENWSDEGPGGGHIGND